MYHIWIPVLGTGSQLVHHKYVIWLNKKNIKFRINPVLLHYVGKGFEDLIYQITRIPHVLIGYESWLRAAVVLSCGVCIKNLKSNTGSSHVVYCNIKCVWNGWKYVECGEHSFTGAHNFFIFFFIHSWFSALNKKEAGMILFSIVGISHSDIKRNMKKN